MRLKEPARARFVVPRSVGGEVELAGGDTTRGAAQRGERAHDAADQQDARQDGQGLPAGPRRRW